MIVGAQTYEQIALAGHDRQWELHRHWLREKPGGSYIHNDVTMQLAFWFMNQLDEHEFHVCVNAGRVKYGDGTYFVPDVFVVTYAMAHPLLHREALEVYADPLPIVAEVRSPPIIGAGPDLCDEKIPIYRRRGDREIWRVHPFDHTLTVWRWRPDGSYTETIYREGIVRVETLPGVTVDLDALLAWADEVGREP